MQFTFLRETPTNSGVYVSTGEVVDMTAGDAVSHALDLATANGGRYAPVPYDPVARPAASQRLSNIIAVYAGPDASAVVQANVAVTVFKTGSVPNGADILNTGGAVLYMDATGVDAVAGSPTAIPIQPGQPYHFPYPPAGAVSVVAAQPQPFVAVRY
jgi:hypothetical protein